MSPTAKSPTRNQSQRRVRGWAAVQPYLYVLPAVGFVAVFLLYPMVYTLWQSFTNSDGLRPPQWVGLENYTRLFSDSNFRISFSNTVIWVIASVIIPVGLGFALALLLEQIPAASFFKSSVYLPYTFSAAATGIMFVYIFDPSNGVINVFLRAIGLTELGNTRWLFESPTNTFSMIGAYTWQSTGINLMIFLIGLQSLPKEPLEAARLDGAVGWNFTRLIIIPLMRPSVVIASLMAAVNGFKVFDLIWVMTQGGPGRTSETLGVTMYREGFILFHHGYSSAIAVIISLIALVFAYFYLRSVLDRESHV